MCFVDFKKAFDSISHDKLWVTLMDMNYPVHLTNLLAKLYRNQLAKVKVAGTLSEWFRVMKDVRQGCVLSSITAQPREHQQSMLVLTGVSEKSCRLESRSGSAKMFIYY